jgi:RHS repeat-associated protein
LEQINITNVIYPEGLVTTYTYDAANRLIKVEGPNIGVQLYSYDNNGNMVTKIENGVTTYYSYDYANRLTKVRNQHFEVSYGYDGYGRKVYRWLRYIPTEERVTIPEPEFSSYIWDGANILLEFPQNGMIRNPIEYLQGADGLLSAHYLSWLHDGEEKLIEHTTHFYHYDALGNTIALTNSFGTQVTSYTYNAFGSIREETNGLIPNPFKFVGKYGVIYDPAINLIYMRARWYDPQIGRFITKDPLFVPSFPQNFNQNIPPFYQLIKLVTFSPSRMHLYTYTQNNPINLVDFTGLSPGWEDYAQCMGFCMAMTGAVCMISCGFICYNTGPLVQICF